MAIIADQPATVRGLLLVLFLASTSLYLLGLASLVAASRIAAVPTETPPVSTVEQTVIVLATEVAQQATAAATDTPAAEPAIVLLRASPTASGPVTATPTLEPTPTQQRALPRIVVPPEPSVAPVRAPIQLSPVVTPGTRAPGGTALPGTPGNGTPRGSPGPGLMRPVATGTPTPYDFDQPGSPPTATIRLGQPAPVGSTPAAPAGAGATGTPAGPGLPPGAPLPATPTPAPPGQVVPAKPAPATPTVRR
ncbi:MAG TPA: hypothetical protein VGL23_03350 [Chloroflexota bacterium]|jgi:hypothetical protein